MRLFPFKFVLIFNFSLLFIIILFYLCHKMFWKDLFDWSYRSKFANSFSDHLIMFSLNWLKERSNFISVRRFAVIPILYFLFDCPFLFLIWILRIHCSLRISWRAIQFSKWIWLFQFLCWILKFFIIYEFIIIFHNN